MKNRTVPCVLILAALLCLFASPALAEGKVDRVDCDASRKYVGETVDFSITTSGMDEGDTVQIGVVKDSTDFLGMFFASEPSFSYTFYEAGSYSFSFSVEGQSTPVTRTLIAVQGVESITSAWPSYSLETTDTAVIETTLYPETAYDKTVSYASSDPSVATVDDGGLVTAVSAGSCVIRATAGGGRNVYVDIPVTVTEKAFGFNGVISTFNFPVPVDPSDPVNYGEIGQSADFILDYYLAGEESASVKMNVYRNGVHTYSSGWKDDRTEFSYTFPAEGSYEIEFLLENPMGDRQATERVKDIFIRPAPQSITLPFTDWEIGYQSVMLFPEVTVEPALANQEVTWRVSGGNAISLSNPLDGEACIYAQAEGTCVLTCSSAVNPSVSASITVSVDPVQEIRANDFPLGDTLQVGVPYEFTAQVYGQSVSGVSWTIELRDEDLNLIDSGRTLSHTFEGPGNYVLQLRVRKGSGSENLIVYPVTITSPEITYPVDELVLSTGRGVNSIYLGAGFMRWDYTAEHPLQEDQVSWRVQDSTVASIDRNGYIRARRPGSTVVTAEYFGFEYTLNVRVVSAMTVLKIPEGTTIIAPEAFLGTDADILVLPAGIEMIGSRAFAGMDSLKYVIMEAGDVSCAVAENAFGARSGILASYFPEDEWDDWDTYIDSRYPDWSFMSAASWNIQ